jgi:hypothetical protein
LRPMGAPLLFEGGVFHGFDLPPLCRLSPRGRAS